MVARRARGGGAARLSVPPEIGSDRFAPAAVFSLVNAATASPRLPGAVIAISVVVALEGLAFATMALGTKGGVGLYWGFAGIDLALVLGLFARSESARMVVQGLVALGIVTSLFALGSGDVLVGLVGLAIRVPIFLAIGSDAVRKWTAEPEMPHSFSGAARRPRK